MTDYRIVVLPGDGIGPEVTAEALRVLGAVAEVFGYRFENRILPVGAEAIRTHGDPLPPITVEAIRDAHAVLLGAVGDPPGGVQAGGRRPETGLLELRRLLGAYANLRPVAVHPALRHASPLRPELLEGVDLLIVRELTGGLYYGEPRGREGDAAINTLRYTEAEVERVARVAFRAARNRRRLVTSVDKANVLDVSRLWRDTVTRVAAEFPDVRLEHLYVDYAAMRLVSNPASLDVVLTENMFGDILSDEAAVLAGSLGLLPSASIGDGAGLFEPVHGSAPDIAGDGAANPLGAISSAALLLRHGLGLPEAADVVDRAVAEALDRGARTRDLARPGESPVGTREMGELVARAVLRAGAVTA